MNTIVGFSVLNHSWGVDGRARKRIKKENRTQMAREGTACYDVARYKKPDVRK